MNTIKKEEFERLVIENQLSMYRLAMSILKNSNDAEDAVSETVLTAYEHLSSLKKSDSFKDDDNSCKCIKKNAAKEEKSGFI